MTLLPLRPEDVLREMRTSVVPVDDVETVGARRRQTVAHLRELQIRAGTRREVEVSFRKRFLIAAVVFLSAGGALAARIEHWGGTLPTAARRSEPTIATSHPLAPPPVSPRISVESERVAPSSSEPEAQPSAVPMRATSAARPKSTLGAENTLMQSALSASRDGNDARARVLLDTLLARYPESPLAQNAEVERFRVLKRLGDLSAASREARRYLAEHPDGMAKDEARRLAVEQPASRTGVGAR